MLEVSRKTVVRLWLERQGLAVPRGTVRLSKRAFSDHLERTGALQLDSVNVLDRAHYLTCWSRFGAYRRATLDRYCYRDGLAYEYWGHEASLLPIRHLPLGRRRMKRFPPESWKRRAWWPHFNVPPSSKRRVLKRIREHGPAESADFERRPEDACRIGWNSDSLIKTDKRGLQLLWHEGRLAVRERRQFRRIYDLAERVYPEGPTATTAEYHDSWLFAALSGCGIASEGHMVNYFTGPALTAAERKRVLARNLKSRRIVPVRVAGQHGSFYALPEHLEALERLPEPTGTHLISPFDSLLWQRDRAEQLLDFVYRIEIYVPERKRQFGYYVLPILHDGRLVGRLDPKLHRDRAELEIKGIWLEDDFRRDRRFDVALAEAVRDLAAFVDADTIRAPRGWGRVLG